MEITFDPAKSEKNVAERKLPFAVVKDFDFESALYEIDDRFDYGEVRVFALGMIGLRMHALVFIETDSGIRVVSLRKANTREIKRYEQKA